MRPNILFRVSKYYFDIQTEAEYRILTFETRNRILNVKIRYSASVQISKNERKAKNEKRKMKKKQKKKKSKKKKKKKKQFHLPVIQVHL